MALTTDRMATRLGSGTDAPPNLADLFPQWQRRTACAGLGPADWFGERLAGQDNHGATAKRICATCSVAVHCLDSALERSDEHGIWGGAGEAERRIFAHCRPDRPHGPEPVEGCTCRWCTEWERHRGNLVAIATGRRSDIRPGDRNGRRATHGRRATYARGCRCPSCSWSATALGVLLARFGQSTAEAWERTEGPHGDEETARRLDVAVVELVVGAVVALVALAGVERAEVLAGIEAWSWLDNGTPRRLTMVPWLAENGPDRGRGSQPGSQVATDTAEQRRTPVDA